MNFGLYRCSTDYKDWKYRVGAAASRNDRGLHLSQYLQGYRADPEDLGERLRHPFEYECYDVEPLLTTARISSIGRADQAALFVQTDLRHRSVGIGRPRKTSRI